MKNITKYLNIQHDYSKGVNCFSLIANYYEQELNIQLDQEKLLFNNFFFEDLKALRRVPIQTLYELKNWIKIDLTNIQEFDIIVYSKERRLSHFSMYVGEYKILDLQEKQKSMLRHLHDKQRNNIEGCFRHKQLAS